MDENQKELAELISAHIEDWEILKARLNGLGADISAPVLWNIPHEVCDLFGEVATNDKRLYIKYPECGGVLTLHTFDPSTEATNA